MAWPSEVTNKLIVLAAVIQDTLQDHDPNFTVVTRPRAEKVLFRAKNRNDRIRIMGDPVRYCEVLYQQPVNEDTMFLASGEQYYATHRFSVDVYYEYADADEQGDSSYFEWITLMEQISDPPLGLLQTLRLAKSIEYSDAPAVGESRVTEGGVARVTEGSVSRVAEGEGVVPVGFFAGVGSPSDDAIMNAIIPLSGDGNERAHVTSFTIDVT